MPFIRSLRKNASLCEFSLSLSRACLGWSNDDFQYQMAQKIRFSRQHGLTQQRRISGEGFIRDQDVSLSVLVRKTHLLRHLILKMIILPRQARDKDRENSQRDAFFRRLQMNGMKGSDSDILQSNGLDSYVDDHSSVSRAARLLFRISSMRY